MNQPLAMFTYDGIPPLPEGPETGTPVPGTALAFEGHVPGQAVNGIPLFELVAVKKADGSFMNVEFVSILTPGDPKSIPRHKVTDRHRQLYRPWYEHWKAGLKMTPMGTPLEMWPVLTPAQVHELKAANIFSVEQLRDVSDVNIGRIPMGATVRQQARDWLEAKEKADLLATRTAENQALRDGQTQLQKEVAALNDRLQQMARELAVAKGTATAAPPIHDDPEAVPAPAERPTLRPRTR